MFILQCFLEDGKLVAESDSGEFWVLFGGFAPIGKKVISEDDVVLERTPAKIYRYALSLCLLPLPFYFLVKVEHLKRRKLDRHQV